MPPTRLYELNFSEFLFEIFYDSGLKHFESWTTDLNPALGARFTQSWCDVQASWIKQTQDREWVAEISKAYTLDSRNADKIVVLNPLPPTGFASPMNTP